MSKVKDGGITTAYGAAVRGGYAGTYEQFCADLARLADVLEEFLGFSVTIQTLAAGQPATASYENGVLSLGIPRGDTGNGIQSISLLSTVGLVKTYRITYTNGNHFDFPVADGNGIQSTTLNNDYTLTIIYTDGTSWTSTSIRGAVGATPHLTIGTVQTLEPGQSATATITGTDEDPVLSLGIPKGQSGASDAGAVSYDPESTYNDGTVGKELSTLNRHLGDLDDEKQDKTTYVTLSGTVVTQVGADNTMYLCGELAELTFTAPATGITVIRFTSGSTPTVITLNGITMPDDWTGVCEANKRYDIAVLNGDGLYCARTVT